MKGKILIVLAFLALFALAGNASAFSYSLTARTNTHAYTGESNVTVSGQVTPAPGPDTAVLIRVYNPNLVLVTVSEAPVNGTTGLYSTSFVAGGSSAWVDGSYTINATWGAYGSVVITTTAFSWASSSSTTSSTSSSSTTSSASTSSTASTATGSTTSSATTSSSSSTVSSSVSSTSSAISTSSQTASSGSVPEFPYQIVIAAVFSALVVGGYLVIRSRRRLGPSTSSLR